MTPQERAELERLASAATPGPYRLEWPAEQGGLFTVWGKQGTPPDFTDGWAIPLVAQGTDSNMRALIAAFDAVPALLAENERLRDAAETVEAQLRRLDASGDHGNIVLQLADLLRTVRAALAEPEP